MFLGTASALTIALAALTATAPGAEPPRVQQKGPTAADAIEATGATVQLKVIAGRSKLLRSPAEVRRVAVVDAGIADVVQVSPRELMVLGRAVGKTDVTIWISGAKRQPVVMLVHVVSD